MQMKIAGLLLAIPFACGAADTPEQQVDALFAKWRQPGLPGAAVAVIRDGQVLLSKGYGMADIERSVPVTSKTVFNIASVSKQFTAFAIHLLAQEGKLSLDDDIRKHLPRLHDFGHVITLRHLLHHTSGLRDESGLLLLAGWRPDDTATHGDMLEMLYHQRKLNFKPGAEHLYSNSGYTLLAEVVGQVSGKPLAAFAQERIFAPLGMRHTHFQTDYGDLVAGRALSYQPGAGGAYKYFAATKSAPGPSDLLTTVEDLALWDRNFNDGRVGGPAVLAAMLEDGVLADGKPANYASGLELVTYRGLKAVEHLGGVAGYGAFMLRFPAQRFTVVVLANARNVGPTRLARGVADIYLADLLAPMPAPAPAPAARQYPAEVALDQAALAAVAGYYALSPEFGINFTVENGRLMTQATGQNKFPLFASAEREFYLKVVDAQVSFDAPGADGLSARFVLHQNGRDQPGHRTDKPGLSDAALRAMEGQYYSEELRVLYRVQRKDGKLVMTYPRGELPLEAGGGGTFFAPFPAGRVTFECAAQAAHCAGFRIDTGRVRSLRFGKVTLTPTTTAAAAAAKIDIQTPAPR